jgi:histidinol-phosphate aminotransferase
MSDTAVKNLIRPEVQALTAYHVAKAGGLLKLDAMENPYAWPGSLLEDWLTRLRDLELNRYPSASADFLKNRLRSVLGVPADAAMILGNGSDELIQLIAMAVASPGRVVLAPEPSFAMYRMIATFVGMQYVGIPLKADDFSLDRDVMLTAIDRYQPAIIFLAHPNNPTGNVFDIQLIKDIISAAPGLVVIDEAYFAFAEHSFLESLCKYHNLLIMRTVSKVGLAGLRLGFLVGNEEWLKQIDKLRLPYNINTLTQISVDFALQHYEELQMQTRRICSAREMLYDDLNSLPDIQIYPSKTNFILFRTPPKTADTIFGKLLEAGILIKNLSASHELLRDCLRVTVGKPEENQSFVLALRKAL